MNSNPPTTTERLPTVNSSQPANCISFVQLNMNNCEASALFLNSAYLSAKNIVLLLQEPNLKGLGDFDHKITSSNSPLKPRAAVVCNNRNFGICVLDYLSNRDIVTCELTYGDTKCIISSVYLDKNIPITESVSLLAAARSRFSSLPVVFGGDFNSWNTGWFSVRSCGRGLELEAWLNESKLAVLNDDPRPTYECSTGSSHIDLSICNDKALRLISNYKLIQEVNFSDHHSISFQLSTTPPSPSPSTRIYNTKSADWATFNSSLNSQLDRLDAECSAARNADQLNQFAESLVHSIQQACECSMKRIASRAKSNPWWSGEISALRKTNNRLRKTFQRCRVSADRPALKATWVAHLKTYRAAMADSKTRSLTKALNEMNSDLWRIYGSANRSAKSPLSTINRGDGSHTEDTLSTMNHLIENFFPPNTLHINELRPSLESSVNIEPPFSVFEVEAAVARFSNRKTPGSDFIEAVVLKHCLTVLGDLLLRFFNLCLSMGVFPECFKTGVLCVIPKSTDCSSYKKFRPIVLLSILGKTLERLFADRLNVFLARTGQSSPHQFGFKRNLSTVDALLSIKNRLADNIDRKSSCILISLDITAAFDRAHHTAIINRLVKCNVPINLIQIISSFLRNRQIIFTNGGVSVTRVAELGTPQGSVCSPSLFSALLDDLLTLEELLPFFKAAYADDLGLIFEEHQFPLIDSALQAINDWGSSCGLQFNSAKTKAMMVTRRRKRVNRPLIMMNGEPVEYVDNMRYLGVVLDSKLLFTAHLQHAARKARIAFQRIKRVIGKHWGLSSAQLRLLYTTCIQSILSYASPVWAAVLDVSAHADELIGCQRSFLLPIIRAEHHISNCSLFVLTGVMPITIFIKHLINFHRLKKDGLFGVLGGVGHFKRLLFETAIEDWNEQFSIDTSSDLSNFIQRVDRSTIASVGCRLCPAAIQFVTGHGVFSTWFARTVPNFIVGCRNCGSAEDGPLHVLFDCPTWSALRLQYLDGTSRERPMRLLCPDLLPSFNAFCATVVEARRHLYSYT